MVDAVGDKVAMPLELKALVGRSTGQRRFHIALNDSTAVGVQDRFGVPPTGVGLLLGLARWRLALVAGALALATDETVAMGALTSTLSDAQVAGEEAVTTITTDSRAHKPIAPGAFQINGQFYPAEAESEPVLTWATRTRAAITRLSRRQAAAIFSHSVSTRLMWPSAMMASTFFTTIS